MPSVSPTAAPRAHFDRGPVADTLYLSASQIGRLTTCENQWVLGKIAPEKSTEGPVKSVPLLLGTLMHRLLGAWDTGRPWRDEWNEALQDDPFWEEGFEPDEYYQRAWDIMLDWETKNGPRPAVLALALELPFDLPVPGVPGVRIRGFMDGLRAVPNVLADGTEDPNRTHDHLRIIEYKTMGRWGRERWVPYDPQLWTYLWALDHLVPVAGVDFEAVSTYAYKEPTPEKRFKRIELEWDDDQIARIVGDLQTAGRRALELLEDPSRANKNIGDNCNWCAFQDACLRPETVEIT